MKKTSKIKRVLALCLIFLLSINSFAASTGSNDGSAFITKAEFDSLKNNFQAQIDTYNQNIDSKIDAAVASYLSGVKIDKKSERNIVGHTTDGTLCPLDSVDMLWQQGDLGIKGSATQLLWAAVDGTKEEAENGEFNTLFQIGRWPCQYGLYFTEATGRRKFKNRLIQNVDYRTGVAEWVGYGDTDDSILLASLTFAWHGVGVAPSTYAGYQFGIGCPGYGWGGDGRGEITATYNNWSGWTPTKGTSQNRRWNWNSSNGYNNTNFTNSSVNYGTLQVYSGKPTDNPASGWSLPVGAKSSQLTRNVSNLSNTSIISLTSSATVTRLGASDAIRDFMNDTDMSSHEFNFDYGKNFSATMNFGGATLFVDPVKGSYDATTGAFTPNTYKAYTGNSKLDEADKGKKIGVGFLRIKGSTLFIRNDLGYGRGSGVPYLKYEDDRDKINPYSDLYFGFVKPTDKWSKLWTSRYDTSLKTMKNYVSNLNTLKNTCYYTADEFAPGDNSEHLSINAGLPVCEVEKGETVSFNVKFADSGNYNLWVKQSSFVDNKNPWQDDCLAPSKITNASGTNYPLGYNNSCIKLTGGTEHTIKFTTVDNGYIFLKWSKADGTNDTKGGGRIHLSEKALIAKED